MSKRLQYEKLDPYVFVTKLAGFEHTKHIQGVATHQPETDTDIPMVQGKNIRNGFFVQDHEWFISRAVSDSLPRSVLDKPCILIPYVGSNLGEVGIFPNDYRCHLASNIAKVELISEKYILEYLKYYLQSDIGQGYLFQSKQGSAQPNITMESIRNTLIIERNQSEQQKICDVLSVIDKKYLLNENLCSELESMAKTLYDYWFTQFDFPNEEGKPYRSSGGAMEWNEQLKREIPKGWDSGTINSLMKVENTSVNPQKLGNTVMEHYSIPAFDIDRNPAYEEACTIESGKYAVDPECILTSKLNPHFKRLWDPYCDTENAICSTEFIVYRPRTAWTRSFCYAVLNSDAFYAHMVGKATASTGSRKRIQPDVSASFELAIPDEKTMRSFVDLYAPIMEKQKALYKENRELTKLRDWLLPMLMNGQATVE